MATQVAQIYTKIFYLFFGRLILGNEFDQMYAERKIPFHWNFILFVLSVGSMIAILYAIFGTFWIFIRGD
jgi:hypothetical protein